MEGSMVGMYTEAGDHVRRHGDVGLDAQISGKPERSEADYVFRRNLKRATQGAFERRSILCMHTPGRWPANRACGVGLRVPGVSNSTVVMAMREEDRKWVA